MSRSVSSPMPRRVAVVTQLSVTGSWGLRDQGLGRRVLESFVLRPSSFVHRQAIRLTPRPQPVRQIRHAQIEPGQLQQLLRRVVAFGMDGGIVQRILAARHAQETGGLLERLRPQPLTFFSSAREPNGPFSSRCAMMAWATFLLMPAT